MSGLPAEFGSRVTVRTEEHLAPGVPEQVRAQGFESHGLIIRRGDRVLFKEADHRVRIEDVRAALRRELGLAPPPS
ncbi:MAG: hypothetical protein ACXWLI_08050 [Myxococcaceae bacterium]